jgi:hypothetical protein
VAITDPGTSLESHAVEQQYRQIFVNPADIGGRYSALSFFGLVPAALVGLDVAALGRSAERMAVACHGDTTDNPGLALGAFMAENAGARRDKLTLLLPDELAPLGAWIEQLVAESTGKEGRGILPVVGEPLGRPSEYGPDRAFVVVTTDTSSAVNTLARELEKAGHPVFRIATITGELGGEFLRWEFATAVAGAALALNPFDEPNVREPRCARRHSSMRVRPRVRSRWSHPSSAARAIRGASIGPAEPNAAHQAALPGAARLSSGRPTPFRAGRSAARRDPPPPGDWRPRTASARVICTARASTIRAAPTAGSSCC